MRRLWLALLILPIFLHGETSSAASICQSLFIEKPTFKTRLKAFTKTSVDFFIKNLTYIDTDPGAVIAGTSKAYLTPNGLTKTVKKLHGPVHHAEVHGMNHTKSQGDAQKFYQEVIDGLDPVKFPQWLIVGPGLAHVHFQHLLNKSYPQLAKCVVAVEPMQNLTDNQIVAYAKNFFTKRGVFSSIN